MSKWRRIPSSELKWQEDLKCKIDSSVTYSNKVVKINENNLAEFNFKYYIKSSHACPVFISGK